MTQITLAQQVQNEIAKKRREKVKGELSKLFSEHHDAKTVLNHITDKIVQVLEDSGESVEGIQEILKGN